MIFLVLNRFPYNSISDWWEPSFSYFQLPPNGSNVAPLVHVRQGRPGIECRIKPFRGQQALAFRRENGEGGCRFTVRGGAWGYRDNCLKNAWKSPSLTSQNHQKITHKAIRFWPSSLSHLCNRNNRDLHLSTITSSEDMDSASNGRSSNICATFVCPDRHQKSGLEKGPALHRMKRE